MFNPGGGSMNKMIKQAKKGAGANCKNAGRILTERN